MEDNEQTPPVQVPTEANNYKHIDPPEDGDQTSKTNNKDNESWEERRLRHDADSGNDGPPNDTLLNEQTIDPGNEHHHKSDQPDKKTSSYDSPSRHDADAGGDGTGTTGPEPGEGKNDEPDTSGEAG